MSNFNENCHRCKFMVIDQDVNDRLCVMNQGATCNLTAIELELEGVSVCDAFQEGSYEFDYDYEYEKTLFDRWGEK